MHCIICHLHVIENTCILKTEKHELALVDLLIPRLF